MINITVTDNINILNIPEKEKNIGFFGDNDVIKKEFFVPESEACDNAIYRLFLTFENGTVNFFNLNAVCVNGGVLLTWLVKAEHIFDSGNVAAQIKAYVSDNEVYHTTTDYFVVKASAEQEEYLNERNAEFLQHEKFLNDLIKVVREERTLLPYVGENGNWYIYDSKKGEYIDSGFVSAYKIENPDIRDGAVTPEKLDRRYWAFNYKLVTSFADLNQYLVGNDISSAMGTIYQLGFDKSFEEYDKLGEDVYLAFINDTDSSGALPLFKFVIINARTFEMWSYVPGSKQIDSFTPSIRNEDNTVESRHIKAAAVTAGKLGNGAINNINLFSMEFIEKHLSMPMSNISISGAIQNDTYNSVTETGVYNVGSSAGEREMLVVYKLSTAHVVQLRYTTEKIYFRGIHAEEDGKFPASEWSEWVNITAGGSGAQDFVYAGSFSAVNELINYAFDTKKVYRVDLSNILGGVVPLGCYLCRKYYDAAVWDDYVIELSPFVADGKKYVVVLSTGECLSLDTIVVPEYDETDVNRHAGYFTITDDGELSLKPEYRGATSKGSDYPNSVSDNGAGIAGSLNAELPKDLVIPEIVNEIAVDRLTAGMFVDNKAIESLTFPITIDEISEQCCHLAVNLKTIKNTEHIKKIGTRAFASCRLEKVVFPSLEELGGLNFLYNPHLVYADLGNITTIPANTFTDALSLTKVKADNVTKVDKYAFLDTPRLIKAAFVKNITSIGNCGFWRTNFEFDWSSLTDCTFGTYATVLQANPTDFWSDVSFTPCENPVPTRFCQKDDRWVNKYIGGSNLKYKDGCLTIASIHIYCGFNDLSLSSVTEFENIVNAINPELLNNIRGYMPETKQLLEGLGFSVTYNYGVDWNSEILNSLYETINNGGYAIVSVGTDTSTHAITVYGINEKGELLCLDSEKKYFYDSSKPALYSLPVEKLILSQKHKEMLFVTNA